MLESGCGCLGFLVVPLAVLAGLFKVGHWVGRWVTTRPEFGLPFSMLLFSSATAWVNFISLGTNFDEVIYLPVSVPAVGWILGLIDGTDGRSLFGLFHGLVLGAMAVAFKAPAFVGLIGFTVGLYLGITRGHLPLRVLLLALLWSAALAAWLKHSGPWLVSALCVLACSVAVARGAAWLERSLMGDQHA